MHAFYHPHEQYVSSGKLSLCYEVIGESDAIPIVLLMGLACQMTAWPPEFIEPLVAAGRRVVRMDNRDIGKSSEVPVALKGPVPLAFARFKLGLPVSAAYRLQDLATDTLRVLDAQGIARAHFIGVSMGGMIAQILAASAPERVRSLSLMMTSDNSPRLPMPDMATLWKMNGGGIKGHDREAALQRGVAFWKTVASPAYHTPEERVVQRITRDYLRSYRPAGIVRQMRAVLATGSIEKYSRAIKAPTLILHGAADPLVRPQAARRLADIIPGAHLEIIPGWGHDLPLPLCARLAHRIIEHMTRAETPAQLAAAG
jgi:pimeloyl-ACP methyl ester carboxylesterase